MNVVAILNPNAGRGIADRLLPQLRVQLNGALVNAHMPRSGEEATEHVRDAVRDGADVILAAGGDGTLNAVINGMVDGSAALAVLPAGSANDFAQQNGCARGLQDVCRDILRGGRKRVDLIDVNGWRYATDGGLGLCASVAGMAAHMRTRGGSTARRGAFGSSLYPLAAVRTLLRQSSHCSRMQIAAEGWSEEVSSPLLMISNQRLLGGYFPIAPSARNDDGLFDVCMVSGRNGRLGLLRLVTEVLRERHIDCTDIRCWQDHSLRVQTDVPVPYLGDGELSDPTDTFHVLVLPGALRIVSSSIPSDRSVSRRIS